MVNVGADMDVAETDEVESPSGILDIHSFG